MECEEVGVRKDRSNIISKDSHDVKCKFQIYAVENGNGY